MIFNNIKMAYRNLVRNSGYSILNIFGLAIGITCASLIFLWVEDEMSFDANFPKQDLIYYVPTNQQYDGEWRTFYSTPGPLAEDLRNEVAGVVKSARTSAEELLFTFGDKSLRSDGRFADPDFLEIFSLNFLEGDRKTAFNSPEAIVLTQKLARQIFGDEHKALGQVLKVNDSDNYTVTGVVENWPENVSFPMSWLAPFEPYSKGQDWMLYYGNNFADTFVEISPNADFAAVDKQVRALIPRIDPEDNTYAFLHSVKDWHLRSKFEGGKIIGGRITYVRLFVVIAFVILLIACVNFMNLSTAQSEKRANEVGVRKAMGSSRQGLLAQFLTESLFLSFVASALSILMLALILPQFNVLIEKELSLGLTKPSHLFWLLGISIFCGLLAGLYPAFFLSSFKPVKVLKGIRATDGTATFIRRGLVVGQFCISVVFIIFSILVYQQIQHAKSRDLGYDKEQLISMRINEDFIPKFDLVRHELIKTGAVQNATMCNSELLSGGNNGSGYSWQGSKDSEDVLISRRNVTQSFFETTGMKIIDGRGFSNVVEQDTAKILVSQSLAKMMGDESPVGKMMVRGASSLEVIGVVNDYVYGDMFDTSDPVVFMHYPQYAHYMFVKTQPDSPIDEALMNIEAVLQEHYPAYPFEYTFVDASFDAKFRTEQLVGKLSQLFTVLAIFISCLGLFGLAAYTAERRRKEIGVRKVLGAKVSEIVRLLSADFLRLLVIAIAIAIPVAWYVASQWLQGYAYRIEISWWVFVIASLMVITIAMITISYQAIKAAIKNPTLAIKSE